MTRSPDSMATHVAASVLRYAVLGASLWYLALYLAVAVLRLRYPFELEWMEGGSVDHVVRVLEHQALYVQPQIAFIPYDYPPLYFYLSALVAKVVGIGYFPLRIVSFVSSLVCFGCIYRIVTSETGRGLAGVLAVGLFAATFRISGAWMDIARVDSLFLALFLLAVLILRRPISIRSHLLAGLMLSLSFLTKQTALAMALPVIVYALYARGRAGFWLAASLFGVLGVSTALFHVATNGWYTFYVWEFPFKHEWAWPVATTFWTQDMFGQLPLAFPCVMLIVVWQIVRPGPERLFWPAVFVGMIGGAYRSKLQAGGYENALLPAYAITAILLGLAVGKMMDAFHRRSFTHHRLAEAAVYTGCLIQMALLAYSPGSQLPRTDNRAAAEHLLKVLSAVPGDVLVPYHGYVSTAVGKPAHAHLMQVYDILKIGDAQSAKLAEQFRSAFRQTAFDAIVLDDTTHYFFMGDVEASYALQSTVFADPGVLLPVTGWVVSKPQYVYVPKAGVVRRR